LATELPSTNNSDSRAGELAAESGHAPRRKRRALRRLAVLLAITLCLGLCHAWILQGLAALLVVRQPAAGCNGVLALDGGFQGPDWYDEAARLYHEDRSRRILLIEPHPGRVVRLGVLPSYEADSRHALAARGVPAEAVELLSGEASNVWAEARLLQTWLKDRPDARLLVLCSQFAGRHQRHILDAVLDPDDAARVSVRALPNPYFDETDWWKSRTGWKACAFSYLRLAYVWCQGESPPPPDELSPADYQQMLRQRVAEGAP
jgi:hypothetical protein